MNVVTRADWDGLVSCVLLGEVEDVRNIRFVHPKDAQDGLVEAGEDDIVVNVPYIRGCGLWFHHHASEEAKLAEIGDFRGRFETAPSCARVVYNHYAPEHAEKLAPYTDLLEAADKLDSGRLTQEDITDPTGWILLGLTMDPRSGLGPEFEQYFRWLLECVKELPVEKVLQRREVRRRCERMRSEQEEYRRVLARYSYLDENVVVVDFRGLVEKPAGPRFLVYTMFPEANVEMRIFDGHQGAVVVALGHSVVNRTCSVDLGKLLSEYGGGGQTGAGTCQLDPIGAEEKIIEIRNRLRDS